MIRQSLMCHGDIAIETYRWKADRLPPWPIFHIEHECRNWDSILQWAKEHHVPSMQGGILRHPTHGISTNVKKEAELPNTNKEQELYIHKKTEW